MTKPRIVFMGSPEIAVPFLDFTHRKGAELLVVTQKDKVRSRGCKTCGTPVKARAETLGLTVYDGPIKTETAREMLAGFSPDLFFVVAYGKILPKHILEIPKIAPVNVHFSMLPKYRGATPVNSVLLQGETGTGTTLMRMDEGLDTGDILWQRGFAIEPNDNATTLFTRLISLSLDLLEEHWESLITGRFNPVKQTGESSTTTIIKKEDLILDWTQDAVSIINRIRAFNMLPGVKTNLRGARLFIGQARFNPGVAGKPGEIMHVGRDFFTVACGSGGVDVLLVKPECKGCMPAQSFIAGYRPAAGEILC